MTGGSSHSEGMAGQGDMDEQSALAEAFEDHRSHLHAVAYRMLGSVSEADDAVQEAWLRLSRTGADGIDGLGAWLTTVVSRVCLNALRSRRTRREESLEARVPELVVSRPDGDPEHEALLADAVNLALLVVLERLSPPERLAFVLHDVFAVPFDEIAPIVDRSPAATPLTRAGRTYGDSRANMSARLATAVAPRTSTESCGRSGPPSERRTTSGSSVATSASKSPS